MRLLIDLALALAGVALFEGVAKPALASIGRAKTRKYVARLFELLDPIVPTIINEGSYFSLKDTVNRYVLQIGDEEKDSLTPAQVAKIIEEWDRLYSPLANAEKLKGDPKIG